ncbi:Mitogen-activated protein kinase [Hondaea fermentalgiana]|uniref:Mitogen-activated protein kinase n=1 Tax=Hondaea fermentalgiana TaxID=2315210 RepID=A0A2R5G9Y1_9STRA|nr:Mitogen-activated protein kinase [Hondaea fermentalgiana]|eukprot:GBG24484.1 Mitogen-activated protein kinase [Hondaea fermentalgiana]
MVFDAYGTKFDIDDRYSFIKALGKGAYGVVCSTRDAKTGNKVAIKKICPMAKSVYDAKHTLREIRLLRHCGQHPNIITLVDLMLGDSEDSLYIGMECMDTDLHRIIQSSQKLSISHHKHFMYQLVLGIEFLHSKGILHRDLKPANLLVSKNCDLRISDFGLARRAPDASDGKPLMTEHVVTRWYRPPELMLSPDGKYTAAVDVWSIGCIFAELLGRTPLFPGKNFVHQLQLIFDVIGTPHSSETAYIKNSQAIQFLRSLPKKGPVDLASIYPHACQEAIHFMSSCIRFSASDRTTVESALAHPFFDNAPLKGKAVHIPEIDETRFNFEFEQQELDEKALREIIIDEVADFVEEHGLRPPPKRARRSTAARIDTSIRALHARVCATSSSSSSASSTSTSRKTMSARTTSDKNKGTAAVSDTNIENSSHSNRKNRDIRHTSARDQDDDMESSSSNGSREHHTSSSSVDSSSSTISTSSVKTTKTYASDNVNGMATGTQPMYDTYQSREEDHVTTSRSQPSYHQQQQQHGDAGSHPDGARLRKKSRSFTSRIISTSNKLSKSVTGHEMPRLPSVHRSYSISSISRARSQPVETVSSPMSCSDEEDLGHGGQYRSNCGHHVHGSRIRSSSSSNSNNNNNNNYENGEQDAAVYDEDEFDARNPHHRLHRQSSRSAQRYGNVQEEQKDDMGGASSSSSSSSTLSSASVSSASSSSASSTMLPIRNILRKQRAHNGTELPLREINRGAAYNSGHHQQPGMSSSAMYKRVGAGASQKSSNAAMGGGMGMSMKHPHRSHMPASSSYGVQTRSRKMQSTGLPPPSAALQASASGSSMGSMSSAPNAMSSSSRRTRSTRMMH